MLSLDREELLLLFVGLGLMYIDRVHDNSTIKRHEMQLRTVAASELAHSLNTALYGRRAVGIGLGGRYIFHSMYRISPCIVNK